MVQQKIRFHILVIARLMLISGTPLISTKIPVT